MSATVSPNIVFSTTNATTFTGSSSYVMMGTEPALGPDQASFSAEEALGKDGKIRLARVHVRCPHCAYPNYPFKRKRRPEKQNINGAMPWNYQPEGPYGYYQCWCVYCFEAYTLVLFPPK